MCFRLAARASSFSSSRCRTGRPAAVPDFDVWLEHNLQALRRVVARLERNGVAPAPCRGSWRYSSSWGWKRESAILIMRLITSESLWPRRSATPYSVTITSRRCLGMVAYSRSAVRCWTAVACPRPGCCECTDMERAPGRSWAMATKLYCPPTPLITVPSSSASEATGAVEGGDHAGIDKPGLLALGAVQRVVQQQLVGAAARRSYRSVPRAASVPAAGHRSPGAEEETAVQTCRPASGRQPARASSRALRVPGSSRSLASAVSPSTASSLSPVEPAPPGQDSPVCSVAATGVIQRPGHQAAVPAGRNRTAAHRRSRKCCRLLRPLLQGEVVITPCA